MVKMSRIWSRVPECLANEQNRTIFRDSAVFRLVLKKKIKFVTQQKFVQTIRERPVQTFSISSFLFTREIFWRFNPTLFTVGKKQTRNFIVEKCWVTICHVTQNNSSVDTRVHIYTCVLCQLAKVSLLKRRQTRSKLTHTCEYARATLECVVLDLLPVWAD